MLAFKSEFKLFGGDYYVKVDDDIYTRPDRLATLLAKERSNHHTYIDFMKKGHVITDPKLKCLQGTVILIFQPAEEIGKGAQEMIKEGVLDNVEAIFGIHLVHTFPAGTVASRPGEFLAGCGSFKAKITGKGGHAAIPQNSIDPILAALTSVISLQSIVSREIDPFDSQVVSVGMIHGGTSFNIIPDSATISGTFRAFNKKSFLALRERIEEVIKAQSAVHRCSADVDFAGTNHESILPTVNDEGVYEHVRLFYC